MIFSYYATFLLYALKWSQFILNRNDNIFKICNCMRVIVSAMLSHTEGVEAGLSKH